MPTAEPIRKPAMMRTKLKQRDCQNIVVRSIVQSVRRVSTGPTIRIGLWMTSASACQSSSQKATIRNFRTFFIVFSAPVKARNQ